MTAPNEELTRVASAIGKSVPGYVEKLLPKFLPDAVLPVLVPELAREMGAMEARLQARNDAAIEEAFIAREVASTGMAASGAEVAALRAEVDALRNQVVELRKSLESARDYERRFEARLSRQVDVTRQHDSRIKRVELGSP